MAGEHILIVDDEPEIIDIIKMYLLEENFKVSWAANGEEALQKLKIEDPSLIVLDVMLPDIDGIELCLNIRKISDCPILFISCKSSDIDKVLALSAGGDDYLTKPFSTLELVA
ncbi:MAG: response regulator, partial [Clostridia bacterium]|nr:response regulator [Clostridia bacterium]